MGVTAKIDTDRSDTWAARLSGTNINATTLLATDYLNHFNEVIMLIEMLPDMPDMAEDVLAWEPKTYVRHFADSAFQDKDIAIEAFGQAPENLRAQFEALVSCLDGHILKTQARLRDMDIPAAGGAFPVEIGAMVAKQRRLVEMISSVINGNTAGASADMAAEPDLPADGHSTQDEIDALF